MSRPTTVKVTRHRQVTIPTHLAETVGIREGDILDVELLDQKIIFKKSSHELPHFKIDRKLRDREIKDLIEKSLNEIVE